MRIWKKRKISALNFRECCRTGLTVFGQAMFGTAEYAREVPGAKSDIFAFGNTMYRLLTGELPFAVEHEPLEHAPAWYKLLSDCVRQNPEKRPASAGALVSRLKAFDDNRQAEEGATRGERKKI